MKHYDASFKDQIIKEVQEVGNISLVCRKHSLRTSTVHTWLHNIKNKDKYISKIKILKEDYKNEDNYDELTDKLIEYYNSNHIF